MSLRGTPQLEKVAVCIGMPRAGTTWLYQNLKNHPSISVTKNKETLHYLHSKDPVKLFSYFVDPSQDFLIDINPSYFFDIEAIRTIGTNHSKVILIERGIPEWKDSIIDQSNRFGTRENLESMTFPFSRGDGREIILDLESYNHSSHMGSIEKTLKDKLKVMSFSDLQKDPVSFLNSIERFLGAPIFFTEHNVEISRINSRNHRIPKFLTFLYRTGLLKPAGRFAKILLPSTIYNFLIERYWYGRTED